MALRSLECVSDALNILFATLHYTYWCIMNRSELHWPTKHVKNHLMSTELNLDAILSSVKVFLSPPQSNKMPVKQITREHCKQLAMTVEIFFRLLSYYNAYFFIFASITSLIYKQFVNAFVFCESLNIYFYSLCPHNHNINHLLFTLKNKHHFFSSHYTTWAWLMENSPITSSLQFYHVMFFIFLLWQFHLI